MTGYLWKVFSEVGNPAGASLLAFVTTIHCALTVLRKHRSHPKGKATLILVPSLAFAVSPWFLSAYLWLGVVLATHVLWFVACEKLVPPIAPARAAAAPSAPSREARPALPTPRPAPSSGFQEAPVLAVLAETPDIRTFRFVRPAGFEFKPGQFAVVKVNLDGRTLARCYSISSSPSARGYLEISVRNQGQVSGFLHATLRPGMTLSMKGPGGSFVYPQGSRPIVLVGAGIGITPLLCMLRHALESEPTRPVTLLFAAKTERHLPFLHDLRLLARRHPLFRLAVALSQGTYKPDYYSGRIDRNLVEAVVQNVRESVYLVCGPLPMIENTVVILDSLGVPRAQTLSEKFEAAEAAASTASDSQAEALVPATPHSGDVDHSTDEADAGEARAGGGHTLRFQRCNKAVVVSQDQSVLEAAEAAGVPIPSMCRAGVCGTCRTKVLEGQVEGDFDLIDDDDRREGYVLSCMARPVENCVVDA
jgi:ferredoxin-NADP reductase